MGWHLLPAWARLVIWIEAAIISAYYAWPLMDRIAHW